MSGGIYSIGHSTQTIERFIGLLKKHEIEIVADVRSSPFSRFNPQFNKESIALALRKHAIKYAFFGKELGARAEDPSCYINGRVQYSRLAERSDFKQAINRLLNGSKDHKIALMCAEKEPLECHRAILVAEALSKAGCEVQHILHEGLLEKHKSSLERLLDITGLPKTDLFKSKAELLAEALSKQESRIAYEKVPPTREDNGD